MSDANSKEIQALADWCRKARSIIGMGVQGDSRKMEKQIDKVAALLKKMSKQGAPTDQQLFAAGMESFRALSAEHQRLTAAHQEAVAAKEKTKKGSTQHAAADEAVTLAREKIRQLMQKMKDLQDELVSDAPLAQAVHFFEVSVGNAERQIQDELTRPHADANQLSGALRILAQWRQELATQDKYQQAQEVKNLTLKIKPLLSGLIRDSSKESSGKRKVDERQSRARAAAEEKLRLVKALLQELRSSGQLTPAVGAELEEAIQGAERCFAAEQWIEGQALLKPLPSRKKCLAAFDAARLESELDFGPELEQARLALAALKLQSDAATCHRFEAATRLLQGRAGDPARKLKDSARLLQDFRAHLDAMKAQIRYAAETAGRLKTLLPELEQSALALAPVAALNLAEENQRQLQLIKVMQAERRWKEAEDTAQLLQSAMRQQGNPDFERWQRAAPELRGRGRLNDLRMAVGNPAATPALKERAQLLLERVAEPKLALLEQARDWTSLMALHGEVSTFVLGLSREIQQFKDFAGARQEASDVLAPRFGRCADALFELERALSRAGADPAPVLQPLQAGLDRLKADWTRRLASAAEAADLDQPRMEQALNELQQAILSANYGKNLEETVLAQRETSGKAEFDQALAALERDTLVPLERLSVALALQYRDELDALARDAARETDPGKPWAQRLLGLQAIAGRAATSVTQAGQACADLNHELAGKADAVALVLSAARKELQSKGLWNSLADRYQPMFAFLEEELAGLRQLLATSNVTAAAGNAKLLQDLKRRADELVRLAVHNKGLDGREERVEQSVRQLEALRKKGLAKRAPETDGLLAEQLAALRRDMFGMEPQVMNQALDEFAAALLDAGKELDEVLTRRTEVEELEKDLRPRVAKLKSSTGTAALYYDQLLERISAAVRQAQQAAQLPAALTALKGIATEVAQAEANPEAALARQKVLNAEAHGLQRLKREYQGRLATVSDSFLPRAIRAVREAGGDKGQIDEVERMIEQARRAADSGNYEQAVQTLVRTENRVVEIEKNPAGTALGDIKALSKHLDTFAGQVNALRAQIDAFVEAAVQQTPPGGREAVRQSLDDAALRVKTQLNPRLFDLYVGDMGNKELPKAQRRATRDLALQRLRELQAFITTQPTVVKLADNPILPLRGPLRLVDSSLTRIDAHLRAAIR